MKKEDVKIGGTYKAKLNGKEAEVRIESFQVAGGWNATDLETNKTVRIKSAKSLLNAVRKKRGQAKVTTTGNVTVVENEPATVETFNNDSSKPKGVLKKPKKTSAKGDSAEPNEKKLSCLNAAIKVLGESSEPMNTKELIEVMEAKGYWSSPGGKTPHATLYSAILRELAKGDESRFVKTERGRFTARG